MPITTKTTKAIPATKTTKAAPATKTPAATKTAPATKAATPAVPSGPSTSELRQAANALAGKAVSAFYSGSSLPFKAATQRLSAVNPNNAKKPSVRQAAAIAAAFTYGVGSISKTGIFTNGTFNIPSTLVNPKAKAGETMLAQIESGALGNMLGNAIDLHSDGTRYVFNIANIRAHYLPLLDSDVRSNAIKAIDAIAA